MNGAADILLAAAAFWFRFLLPGVAWSWILPDPPAGESRAARLLVRCAAILLLGMAMGLTHVLLLAHLGVYRDRTDVGVLAVLVAVGGGLGLSFRGRAWRRGVGRDLALSLIPVAWVAGALRLPGRSEWMLGGWDPGVYFNVGCYLARTGTLEPGPDALYAALTEQELRAFMRHFGACHEVFPAVPVDLSSRVFDVYFFRLAPCLVAALRRCGGLEMAFRLNHVTGALTLLAFAAMVRMLTRSGFAALAAALLLAAQPLWLYHLHLPVSEIVYLLLVFGAWLWLAWPGCAWKRALLLAWFLFLAAAARVSFLPFGGLMLAALAGLDFSESGRGKLARHGVAALGLLAGGAFDRVVCSITIVRLANVWPLLVAVAAAGAVVALLTDLASLQPRIRARVLDLASSPRTQRVVLAGLVVLGAAGLLAYRLGHGSAGLPVIAPWYVGWDRLAAAALGAAALIAVPNRFPAGAVLFFLFGFGGSLLTAGTPNVVPVYPWATRRYFEFMLPWICFLAALVPARVAAIQGSAGRRIAARGLAVALLLILLLSSAGRSLQAWRSREYGGIAAALDEAAARVGSDDVLVADHFWWGTPLSLAYGRPVLNGERIWRRRMEAGEAAEAKIALGALERLREQGRRVLVLTSTAAGLGVFPDGAFESREIWRRPPLDVREMTHRRRPEGFAMRTRTFEFRLHEVDAVRPGGND